MVYKYCPMCKRRKILDSDKMCENCTSKYGNSVQKARYKRYQANRTDKEHMKQYKTKEWKKCREDIKSEQMGLCLMSLIEGAIESIDVVHHIKPSKEEVELFYCEDNLIGVSSSKHNLIHKAYEENEESKKKMIEYLLKLKSMSVSEIMEINGVWLGNNYTSTSKS
ncbi:MAG: hypothetical protein RSE41_06140 [Clostridia bacterium]